jgi:chromosome segregation ATPase
MSHEPISAEQLDPSTLNEVDNLNKFQRWFSKDRWIAPKRWLDSFMLFLETAAFWKKATLGFLVSIPLVIAGSLIPLLSLVIVGSVLALFCMSVIGIFEYYKYRHQKEKRQIDELCSEGNESLAEFRHLYEQSKQNHEDLVLSHITISESLHSLETQKKQLEGKLKELQQRESVLSVMNEGLSVERDALRTIVIEKENNQHALREEINGLGKDRNELATKCTQLSDLTNQLSNKIYSETHEKDKLTEKLRGLYKQRRFLVEKIHCQQREIESLTVLSDKLENEIRKLQQRIFGLNETLLEQVTIYKKVTSKLSKMTEEVLILTKQNGLMEDLIKVLIGQKEELAMRVGELCVIEKELYEAKNGLEIAVKELNTRIGEQKELLSKQQLQAQQTLTEFEANQHRLDKTLIELEQTKKTVGEEIQRLKAAQAPLISLVDQFSSQVIAEEGKKKAFMDRLDSFLADKEVSIEQFIADLKQLNQELNESTSKFKELNGRHNEVLEIHEGLMIRLQQAVVSKSSVSESSIFKHISANPQIPTLQQERLSM